MKELQNIGTKSYFYLLGQCLLSTYYVASTMFPGQREKLKPRGIQKIVQEIHKQLITIKKRRKLLNNHKKCNFAKQKLGQITMLGNAEEDVDNEDNSELGFKYSQEFSRWRKGQGRMRQKDHPGPQTKSMFKRL